MIQFYYYSIVLFIQYLVENGLVGELDVIVVVSLTADLLFGRF